MVWYSIYKKKFCVRDGSVQKSVITLVSSISILSYCIVALVHYKQKQKNINENLKLGKLRLLPAHSHNYFFNEDNKLCKKRNFKLKSKFQVDNPFLFLSVKILHIMERS